MLFPGAGKIVQRTDKSIYCGTMTGRAFDATEHPSKMDAAKLSVRFAGEVLAVTHDGEMLRGAEWYLPGTVARGVRAALRVSQGQSVAFSVEIWCEPDDPARAKSALGYSYAAYDRIPTRQDDPLMTLAYEAGILERPAPALTHEGTEPDAETIDPETGEVIPAQSAAA
jgi:hypothetical protein